MRILLLCVAMLAGCTTAPADAPDATQSDTATQPDTETQSPCWDPNVPSGNAPLLPAFVGSPDEVAQRVAAALGESDPATIKVETSIRYDAGRVWPALDEDAAREEVERYFAALDVPGEIDITFHEPWSAQNLHPVVSQVFEGGKVTVFNVDTWTTPDDARSRGVVGPMYDLGASTVEIKVEEAVAIAAERDACTGPRDAPELTRHLLSVFDESIVWRLDLLYREEGHHCSGEHVSHSIDAVTGYVHHTHHQPCI